MFLKLTLWGYGLQSPLILMVSVALGELKASDERKQMCYFRWFQAHIASQVIMLVTWFTDDPWVLLQIIYEKLDRDI